MNRSIPIFMSLLLGACGLTPQGDAFRGIVKEKGGQVMDQGLTDAEWFMCEAASVGSVKRRYGGGKSGAYNELCAQRGEDIVK